MNIYKYFFFYFFLSIKKKWRRALIASKNRISIKIQSLRKNALNSEHRGRHSASPSGEKSPIDAEKYSNDFLPWNQYVCRYRFVKEKIS